MKRIKAKAATLSPSYRYRFAVKHVHDGDTMTVDVDLGFFVWLKDVKFRLAHIQAPELATPAGLAALAYVQTQCVVGQLGLAEVIGPDKFGNRWDAVVYFGDVALNDLLVQTGNAVRWNGEGVKP